MGSYTNTPPTFLAGELPDADKLTEISNFMTAETGAWTAYTPAWTAVTTNPVIANGTITGAYRRIGKTVDVRIRVLAGSTTTYGSGQYFLSLPFSAVTAWQPGSCRLFDSGTANKSATAFVFSTLDKVALVQNITDVSAAAPHVMAVGDEIEVNITYEAL